MIQLESYSLTVITWNTSTPQKLDTVSSLHIEAESYQLATNIINKGSVIGGLDLGSVVRYDRVQFFPSSNQVRTRIAVDDSRAGQVIEFRLDGEEGELIASLTVPPTGGYTQFQEVTTSLLKNVSGVHSLYVLPKGGNGLVTGAGDMDWIEFIEQIPTKLEFQYKTNQITIKGSRGTFNLNGQRMSKE